jgi:tetratricopeptide (TPR) repeat protein
VQEATFAARQGDLERADGLLERAEQDLTRTGELRWLARLYNNRGLIRVYSGRAGAAVEDLQRAVDLYADLGFRFAYAEGMHNLGVAHANRGDLVTAIRLYKEAGAIFLDLDCPMNEMLIAHAEALIDAGLFDLALEKAAELAASVGDGSMALDRAETFFLYARAALLAGDWRQAADAAATAEAAFDDVGGAGWSARSQLLRLRALEYLGDAVDVPAIVAVAEVATAAGQVIAAWYGLLSAARRAAATGDTELSDQLLLRVRRDSEAAGVSLVELDLDMALTSIAIAQARAKPDEALATAKAAIETMRKSADAIGYSGDSAAMATQRLEVLEEIGTVLASAIGPEEIAVWTSDVRSFGAVYPRLVPTEDPNQAQLLEHLRWIDAEMMETQDVRLGAERSELLGRLAGTGNRTDRGRRDPRDAILMLSRGVSQTISTLTVCGATKALGVVDSGELDDVADRIRMGIAPPAGGAGRDDLLRMEEAIFGVAGAVEEAEVVISAPPSLLGFPWSILPKLTDKALTVAVSPAAFRPRAITEMGPTIAIAGPGLEHSDAEALRIAGAVSDGVVIGSAAVSRDAVLDAMSTAAVFHFAGHSVFRIDNPGLSFFDLGGERLYAWELAALDSFPRVVVLASCSSGGAQPVGTTARGFVGTLLALGVEAVVAAVVPISDATPTSDMLVGFHRFTAEGHSVAGALREARLLEIERMAGSPLAHSFQAFAHVPLAHGRLDA